MAQRWLGQPLRRTEDERLIRGAGRYVADIKLPGQLHAAFVRSQMAHALISEIDAREALSLPGVVGVLTASDVPQGPLPPFLWDAPPPEVVETLKPLLRPCHPPLLPVDRVRFLGQAVAMVVAESRYLAEDAGERMLVGYEPLRAVATIEDALRPDAPVVHDGWPDNVAVRFDVRKGDIERALDQAHLVVRERFEIQRQAGIPLETRGCLAQFDLEDERLTLWSSTQNPHPLQRALSRVTGLPIERVRVVAPDVGGGFGVKGVLYPEDLLCGLAAMRLHRPVKWIEDRQEHMQSAIHAREQSHDIELAVSEDGTILGVRDRIRVDTGAFNPLGLVIPHNTITHLMGPYRVPHLEAVAEAVITNKVPTAPYRGAGRPEAVFAMERAIERAARVLGLDPLEFRRRNLVRPEEMPYPAGIMYRDGHPLVLDSGNYPELVRRAAALVAYERASEEAAAARAAGRHVGLGMACYLEGTGIGPFEGAAVEVDEQGHVTVHTGAASQGQGHATVLSQICSDALGVDPSRVTVIGGDTAGIDWGWGTVASRSAVTAGNAVSDAAGMVREKALETAADLLEVAPEDLILENGRVAVAGATDRSVELSDLAQAARTRGSALSATFYYEPPTVTWAGGVHAVAVEVDVQTGEVHILRYAVAHDCGTVINPMIVDGQIRGGVAQGIAGALYEEVVYDENGQLLNATLADYLVPTAAEVPPVLLDHLETPSPLNPLGIKGVGEGGAVPAPAAIANAVEDALAPLGVVIRRTPLSPPFLRSLIEGATGS